MLLSVPLLHVTDVHAETSLVEIKKITAKLAPLKIAFLDRLLKFTLSLSRRLIADRVSCLSRQCRE